MRGRYLLALWLVVVWVALWGRLSVANIVSGIVVAVGLLVLLPLRGPPPRYVLRPWPFLQLVGFFVLELLRANLALVRDVVSRRDRTNPGVIAVPIEAASDGVLTLVANMTALTPGTIAVEVRRDRAVIYVHVLNLRDAEAARAEPRRLEFLAVRAFGSRRAVEQLNRARAHPHPPDRSE